MPTQPDPARIESAFTRRFGVEVHSRVSQTPEGPLVSIRPADIHENEGFAVITTLGWRSVRSEVVLGKFSADLVRGFGESNPEQRNQFQAMARALRDRNAMITLRINTEKADPLDWRFWPSEWRSFSLTLEKVPLDLDHEMPAALEDAILEWGGQVFGLLLALSAVEEIPETNGEQGLPEGALERIEVNRYERSRLNRLSCIAAQGTSCKACGFDFAAQYGDLGRDYIHVHHVTPVSQMGANYIVNPATDLVPLCPNCHSMVHRTDPPITVEELKIAIARAKQKER